MRRVDASTERRLGEGVARRGRRLAGREAVGTAVLVAGFPLPALVQALSGRTTLSRVPVAVSDAWFSLAPAATLCALGAQLPTWGHWPAFAAALAAQLLADAVISTAWDVWCPG